MGLSLRRWWHRDFQVAAGLGGINRFDDSMNVGPEAGPLLPAQNHDGDFAAGKILLVAHVFVGGQQHIEAGGFRGQQQFAVLERVSALLRGGANFVSD